MSNPSRPANAIVGSAWRLWWSVWSAFFVIFVIVDLAGAHSSTGAVLGGLVGAAVTAGLASVKVVANGRPIGAAKPRRALRASSRLPGQGSAAREPMQRLAGAEIALRDLLRQLGDAAVARDVVDAAWHTATDTAARLRALAAKVEAVEAAVAHAAAGQRAALADGTRNLLAHIERGVDGYQELVAAAGHLVLADSVNPVPDALVEATDHLAGLAAALRELSSGA